VNLSLPGTNWRQNTTIIHRNLPILRLHGEEGRTWHRGGATHSSICPPASTGLAHCGTSAATGGKGDRASALPPAPVGPPQFCPFSSVVWALMNLVVVVTHARDALLLLGVGKAKAGRWGRRGVGHSGLSVDNVRWKKSTFTPSTSVKIHLSSLNSKE
jgi:hypothetical protein